MRDAVLAYSLITWDYVPVAGQFHYQFEWDPRKARQNLKRHGVAFERAATIFLDRSAFSEFDENTMKSEYDFSKAKQGKFYRKSAVIQSANLP